MPDRRPRRSCAAVPTACGRKSNGAGSRRTAQTAVLALEPEQRLGHGPWRSAAGTNASITYVLAAGAPRYGVEPLVYHRGFAAGREFLNGKSYYDIKLPLGMPYGGPLFFSHYSFCGLDPHGLKDSYADYWQQNVAHARINHAHCAANPHGHLGYGGECWGLTASDDPDGYAAHDPANDNGTISPTAALSSLPYTPHESLAAIRHFLRRYGDKVWGRYGFVDAFCERRNWYAETFLAIDQGPIIIMMENHRSGLLWKLFMSDTGGPDRPAAARLQQPATARADVEYRSQWIPHPWTAGSRRSTTTAPSRCCTASRPPTSSSSARDSGRRVQAHVGSVVASPVLAAYDPDPDYFFHWYRDSAVVMDALRILYERGTLGDEALQLFEQFVQFSLGSGCTGWPHAGGSTRSGASASHPTS